MTRAKFAVVAVLCAAGVAAAAAQTFDAVSIHKNTSGTAQGANTSFTQGGVTFTNMQLRPVIQFAYGISQPARLVGVPDWANAERWDIVARGKIDSLDERRAMLQAMLADRFKLVAHTEQRRVPIYTLVLARGDGRLGPDLKPSATDCTAQGQGRGGQTDAPPPVAPAAPANPLASLLRCGLRPGGPGDISVVGIPFSLVSAFLSIMQGRPVVDATGLKGAYDIHLVWAPDPIPGRAAPPPAEDRADIFTALQEQLGLKLQPGNQPEDVLVIDSVSRPDEN